jgi:hypothetical protein
VCGLPCAKNVVESVDAKTFKNESKCKKKNFGQRICDKIK